MKGLPPHKAHDHAIVLNSGTKPISIRPNLYAHHHKDGIQKQVEEMLSEIKHSNSPFSSPVTLVKKKDGSWRMCVGYRALLDPIVCPKLFSNLGFTR